MVLLLLLYYYCLLCKKYVATYCWVNTIICVMYTCTKEGNWQITCHKIHYLIKKKKKMRQTRKHIPYFGVSPESALYYGFIFISLLIVFQHNSFNRRILQWNICVTCRGNTVYKRDKIKILSQNTLNLVYVIIWFHNGMLKRWNKKRLPATMNSQEQSRL